MTAYAPTGNKDSKFGSYYKQILRYIQRKGLRTNPKAMFREDLCRELRHWRSLGDQVLLMMDANENVLDGAMVKKMALSNIGMRAAVHSQTMGHGPKTHIRGSQSIDDIFFSPGLVVAGASYLPFCEDLGDHRNPIADVTVDSLLGRNLPNIAPPKARKLSSKSPKSCNEYLSYWRIRLTNASCMTDYWRLQATKILTRWKISQENKRKMPWSRLIKP